MLNRSSGTKRRSILIGMTLAAMVVFANLGTHAAFGTAIATNVSCVNGNSDPTQQHASTKPTTGAVTDVTETFTCTATAGSPSVPVPNAVIDAENTSGVNDTETAAEGTAPDYKCTTVSNGTCTITVPSTTPTLPLSTGTGNYCFWIDQSNDTTPPSGCSADPSARPANVDVATVTWVTRVPSSLAFTPTDPLDDTGTAVSGTVEKIHVVLKDQFGSAVSGSDIDMFIIGGPNRGSSQAVPYSCPTGADGTCEIDYQSNGFDGTDHVCVWLDANGTDNYVPGGAIDHGGSCLALSDGRAGDPLTDLGRVMWQGGTPAASDLTISPNPTPVATGTQYGLSVTVRDQDTNPMPNQVVNFEIMGVADPNPNDAPGTVDRACTTDANGTCSLSGAPGAEGSSTTFTSQSVGATTVRAWVQGQPIDPLEGVNSDVHPGLTIEPNTTELAAIHFGKVGSTIGTIIAGPNTGVYGFSPVIQGTVRDDETNPISGGSVELFRRYAGGSFEPIDSTTTSDQGEYSFRDPAPTAIADYQVAYIGDSAHSPSTGPIVHAWVRVGSIFNVSRTYVSAGHPAWLSGRILPVHPGKRVTLQWFMGNQGVWASFKTVTLDQNSGFGFSYTRSGTGYLIFRVLYWKQDALDLGNVSRIIKVTWQ
ncbi:MAG: Ig-like domain-containing protein [Actinomycetota bacterium]